MSEQGTPQTKVGVSVLVMNGSRVLLVKRKDVHEAGTWGAPGGSLNFGESFDQCAIREVKEETGLDIHDPKFRVVTNDFFHTDQKHFVTIWMEAHHEEGEPQLTAPYETSDIGWFNWDSLPEPLFTPLRHILEGQTYPSQTTEEKLGDADATPANLQY